MSGSSEALAQAERYAGLIRSIEGLRNWRAILLLIVSGVAGIAIFSLGIALTGPDLISAVFAVLAALVYGIGFSMAGIVLMDQAQGLPTRPVAHVFFEGLFASLRIIVALLAGFVVVVLLYILMGALLFLCRIPWIGPLLYALLFPILSIASGLVFFGLYAAFSMTGPAIWSGAHFQRALAMLWQIAVRRTVELLVGLFLLFLLGTLVGSIVMGILAVGVFSVAGLSAGILDVAMPSQFLGAALLPRAAAFLPGFGESSYLQAMLFGLNLLAILISSALTAMILMGMNLIYLGVSAELDPEATETLIRKRLEAAGQKARELQEETRRRYDEAQEARRRAQEQSLADAAAAAAAASPANPADPADAGNSTDAADAKTEPEIPPVCPQCHAPISPKDRFCGTCGYRLGG